MLSISLFCTSLLVTLPTALGAFDRDGEDWRYLQQFFQWTHDKLEGKPRQDADAARGMGTWWDVGKSKNFGQVENHLRPANETGARCGVVFYYDNMFARARLNKTGNIDQALTRPLAVAPICDHNFVSRDWKDDDDNLAEYPGRKADKDDNGGRCSVVFHNAAIHNYSGDSYFVLTNAQGDRQQDWWPVSNFKNETQQFPGTPTEQNAIWDQFDGWERQEAGNVPNVMMPPMPPKTKYIRDWVQHYADTVWAGNVPNPYRYRRGHAIWKRYSTIDQFWGWGEDDRYITDPPI